MYDLVIIGGGPAGAAAAVYAARKQLKTVIITPTFGGQSINSVGIENWVGEKNISGLDLAKKLEEHVKYLAGNFVSIEKTAVTKVEKNNNGFSVSTKKDIFETKTVLVTSGSDRRKLEGVKNADIFEHKGLTYCATCDGPMFKGKVVAVIGGGNSAVESAMQLAAYTEKVYLIHRRDTFKADPVSVESIKRTPNIEIVLNSTAKEITGDNMVNGIVIENNLTKKETKIALSGVFVEIGAEPKTEIIDGIVELAPDRSIKIDPWTQRTSTEGIWAAGDVTNIKYHQNNIAAGDAVRAIEDIYVYVKSNFWEN